MLSTQATRLIYHKLQQDYHHLGRKTCLTAIPERASRLKPLARTRSVETGIWGHLTLVGNALLRGSHPVTWKPSCISAIKSTSGRLYSQIISAHNNKRLPLKNVFDTRGQVRAQGLFTLLECFCPHCPLCNKGQPLPCKANSSAHISSSTTVLMIASRDASK